ncbi:MAG: GAF domain-containing protein [Myxococcales bacterium]|nr:MAG: GAF domain-containing protein [Myxococcales bacterium]
MDNNASKSELAELVDIARAVTQEKDIDRLLDIILQKCRHITNADAGSIYVVEHVPGEEPRLHFKLSQNDSCDFKSSEFTLPISNASVAGAVVLSKRPVNIDDVYDLEKGTPYTFDKSFDDRLGYRTCSMLAVPLVSAKREVLGVVQLINKKKSKEVKLDSDSAVEKHVVPFDNHSEQVLTTLAAQAGIALENALLYSDIQNLFEGFVRASVQAIEQRDPTTSGHSLRVSVLACELASKVDHVSDGRFADLKFSEKQMQELEYASLLHDFGKIGVREQVLLKAKKLHDHELCLVQTRIDALFHQTRADFLEQKLTLIENSASATELAAVENNYAAQCALLREAREFIERANEPTVLRQGDFSRIQGLANIELRDFKQLRVPLLNEEHIRALQVTKGSLASDELEEIRKHVVHTFQFLSRIPWGKTFQNIPEIAAAHHERLDGSGYPYGLGDSEIPAQSKIMTVADIYDALTAADRPYKKSLPHERAMDILFSEASSGHIDADLVRIFHEAQVVRVLQAVS